MSILSKANLAANRANSQKSTGPVTAAGRKRASLNALKHGGTAQTIILPGEDAQHFAQFHFNLKKCLAPANALEESLVATLAQTQWLMDRMRAHETSIFALGHEKFVEELDTDGDQAIQIAFAGAKTVKSEVASLRTTSLYLQRNARMYDMTLKQLLTLQATRKADENDAIEEAADLAAIHRKRKIPFDPKEYGLVCPSEEVEFLFRRNNAEDHPYTRTKAA